MSMDDFKIAGWDREQKFVLAELQRLARAVESVDGKVGGEMTNMKVEIAQLKTKIAVIVIVASALMSALINYLFRH